MDAGMNKKKRGKLGSKLVAMLCALAMVATMLPGMAVSAAGQTSGDSTTDGLVLNKSVALKEDGNYELTLEAYATGKTTTTVEKKGTPLDIVLVLDQSGSMAGSKLSSLKTAVTNFVTNISNNGKEYNVDHRISMVGFACKGDEQNSGSSVNGNETSISSGSSNDYWVNTGLYVNGSMKNYETRDWEEVTTTETKLVLTEVTDVANNAEPKVDTYIWAQYDWRIIHYKPKQGNQAAYWYYYNKFGSIKKINFNDYTKYQYREQQVETTEWQQVIHSLTEADYQNSLVSVNQTSGDVVSVNSNITAAISKLAANGATRTSYGLTMAKNVLEHTASSAAGRNRIVVVFTDGQPGQSGYDSAEAGAAVNSALPLKNANVTLYTVGLYSNPSTEVENFMKYLSSNYPNASYNPDAHGNNKWQNVGTVGATKYYMTTANPTELSNIFTNITEDVTHNSTTVTLGTDAVLRDVLSKDFALPVGTVASDIKAYTVDSKTVASNGTITWEENIVEKTDADVQISSDGKTIDVKNFDYAEKFVASGHPGQKIIVKIPIQGLKAGTNLYTNEATSGIYANATETNGVAYFNRPQVTIAEQSYVLDFGKKVNAVNSEYGLSTTTAINTDRAGATDSTGTAKGTSLTKDYGSLAVGSGTLSYNPTTMNWDGYDSTFAFGTKTPSGNDWAKVNFIPATSVYYEDNFISNTATGVVGIEYSGNYETVTDETKAGATERIQSSENEDYGYDVSYAGDAGYSEGSATHMTSTVTGTGEAAEYSLSKAEFTFTGTGFDLYSSTNMTTGQVWVQVFDTSLGNDEPSIDSCLVDSLYKNATGNTDDTLYQIPTVTFDMAEYSATPKTYKVILTVQATTPESTGVAGRNTYYLDGIRIYNPIGATGSDTTSGNAYKKADEYGSLTASIRDMVLTNEQATAALAGTEKTGVGFVGTMEAYTDENGNITLDPAGLQNYIDYGPKNEVYLTNGQTIAFKLNKKYTMSDYKVMIGMKAPEGETRAEYTNGDETTIAYTNLATATDMYYQVTPTSDGYIAITNEGDNLLALSKIKVTKCNAETVPSDMFVFNKDVADYTAALFNQTPDVQPDTSNSEGKGVQPEDEEVPVTDIEEEGDVIEEDIMEEYVAEEKAYEGTDAGIVPDAADTGVANNEGIPMDDETETDTNAFDGNVTITVPEEESIEPITVWADVAASVARFFSAY